MNVNRREHLISAARAVLIDGKTYQDNCDCDKCASKREVGADSIDKALRYTEICGRLEKAEEHCNLADAARDKADEDLQKVAAFLWPDNDGGYIATAEKILARLTELRIEREALRLLLDRLRSYLDQARLRVATQQNESASAVLGLAAVELISAGLELGNARKAAESGAPLRTGAAEKQGN